MPRTILYVVLGVILSIGLTGAINTNNFNNAYAANTLTQTASPPNNICTLGSECTNTPDPTATSTGTFLGGANGLTSLVPPTNDASNNNNLINENAGRASSCTILAFCNNGATNIGVVRGSTSPLSKPALNNVIDQNAGGTNACTGGVVCSNLAFNTAFVTACGGVVTLAITCTQPTSTSASNNNIKQTAIGANACAISSSCSNLAFNGGPISAASPILPAAQIVTSNNYEINQAQGQNSACAMATCSNTGFTTAAITSSGTCTLSHTTNCAINQNIEQNTACAGTTCRTTGTATADQTSTNNFANVNQNVNQNTACLGGTGCSTVGTQSGGSGSITQQTACLGGQCTAIGSGTATGNTQNTACAFSTCSNTGTNNNVASLGSSDCNTNNLLPGESKVCFGSIEIKSGP